jgi:hypothetical protein
MNKHFVRKLSIHPLIKTKTNSHIFIHFKAKKLREISTIDRRIDDIPTSIELAQYRQAFFQLYNQSAVLYRQTKQNYTLYNTFTDMIDYMNKEILLIESIYQNYPQ